MTDGFIGEQDFKSLTIEQQEALFSLSCLSRNQRWADNVEWSDREWEKHVIDHGIELVDEVIDSKLHHLRKRLGLSSDEEIVEEQLLEGDKFTRRFLAWYLEQQIDGLICESESNNRISEPDVTVYQRQNVRAVLELKRIVNTGNVDEYVSSFLSKDWHENDPNRPSVLLLYFPVLMTKEWRTRTFVQGYQGVIRQLADWSDNWMYIRTFPAPVNANKQFGALRSTETFVEGLKGP